MAADGLQFDLPSDTELVKVTGELAGVLPVKNAAAKARPGVRPMAAGWRNVLILAAIQDLCGGQS